jgi:hypothetical protein
MKDDTHAPPSRADGMHAVFYRCFRAIEHAMSARREYMTKEVKVISGGPDHYARLAATKHFRDFLAAGRPGAEACGDAGAHPRSR